MSSNTDGQVDPNLRMGGDPRSKVRYPSPFFDVGQQYIPPTVKELFKWIYFYCTNNSFLGPALQKIARYPVTDLIFEDRDPELVRFWTTLMNNTMQIKPFNMEVNLDLTSYGNAFVTIHYPFSRHLECSACRHRTPWRTAQKRVDNLTIKLKCQRCGNDGAARIVDVPYRSLQGVRLVRINPEFIDIKYNEATGRHTYLYSIPDKLKRQIMAGDPDIIEDTPQIYLEAIKHKRKIKLSNDNLYHLKNPTLAGKDMGWGLPRIAPALKDLYHFYTLRRAQEAIMNEHITPMDILYPSSNGKMDPYTHTDLSSWKRQMERELANRRRDPNYKAIMPFPVGNVRIGGDGKVLMLTPEMEFLSKVIIGTAGIPQEFVYGGTMQWSGSSISLRTLENDFLHQRTQLLQMNIWLVERFRLYLGLSAPRGARYSDFKMADDMQRMQLMINMASQGKLPWEDVQREFGRDPETVRRKLEEEANFDHKLRAQDVSRQAEAQAKGQQIMARFQARQQTDPGGAQVDPVAIDKVTADSIRAIAERLAGKKPAEIEAAVSRIKQLDFRYGDLLEKAIKNMQAGHSPVPDPQETQVFAATNAQGPDVPEQPQAAPVAPAAAQKPNTGKAPNTLRPLPEQKPPRRRVGGI